MTDVTPTPGRARRPETTPACAPQGQAGAGRGRDRRPPAYRSKIAAVGIGVAAMVGLVSNMEIAGGRAQTSATSSAGAPPRPSLDPAAHRALVRGKIAAAKQHKPIVLTPHTVVHSVAGPSASGSAGGGYVTSGAASASGSSAAAAPAAAPVASTGGSH